MAEIAIQSSNDTANSVALALCLAPISAGSFTFPQEILQSLPPSPVNATRVPAWVGVGSAPLLNPGTFSAGGLQGGFLIPGYAAINAVTIE